MTLIEAARTMLADSLLPIPFWGEAVNTACYVQNRVLVTKPQNKTIYELLHGRTPSIGFMRPFGYLVTILNTLDSLGKFDGKVDEGFLVGYSVSNKAFRVFNNRTRIVQETLHINFLETSLMLQVSKNNLMQKKQGRKMSNNMCVFLFGLLVLQILRTLMEMLPLMKKEPEFEGRKPESEVNVSPSSSAQSKKHDDKTKREAKGKSPVESLTGYRNLSAEFKDLSDNSINEDNANGTLVHAVRQISTNSTNTFSAAGPLNIVVSLTHGKSSYVDSSQLLDDPNMPESKDITYSGAEDDVGAEADFNNLETSITALYGLHQAPRAWYETLANYLSENGFQRGKIDKTLFIKRQKGDILLVQIYVDDIIFVSTNKELCKAFEKIMKDKFQMTSMRELTFFLGLQVKQKKDRIFISHNKYVAKILRKFGLTDEKSASTPTDTEKPLLKGPD
nr:putative ribonuclease H-like domain-containing protein [Tanacetum cinerariifolium]